MNYHRNTACVHLYMNPDENQNFHPNIFIDGEIRDLKALLVTAARMNDNFYNALFESTQWIMRDELGEEQAQSASLEDGRRPTVQRTALKRLQDASLEIGRSPVDRLRLQIGGFLGEQEYARSELQK